ncbi:MAG TPA: pyridoxal-phosphate dependent enzyme, partial [Burkholderiaceae bacterium]|nr:pyridoxal-phosphate dependent enzyme [Burkholderiaceae bacterium]
ACICVIIGPAVGSNPLGIEGYKTIAFEVAEAMRWQVPDWFAVPVCYGDSLYGIWKGFEQLRALGWIDRVPRLLAAEVSGSLTQALADGTDVLPVCAGSASVATSIAAPQGTYQGLAALRASGGRSLRVRDEDILQWQAKLARLGLYAEASSVATLPAIERLRADRTIAPDETVVSLLTASGMKDSAALHGTVAAPPRIDADARSALNALRQTYGFDAER